jgi:[ribosomal protein S5]-alanine N-acetyltransferase
MDGKQIKLLECDATILQKAIEGDKSLSEYLNVNIPKRWTEFGEMIFHHTLKIISKNPTQTPWTTYFPIFKAENMLIGTCGYKGSPDSEGMVEIGYEVAEDYRGRGIATEIVNLLINNAFTYPNVQIIQAHTLANTNASTRVLEKSGFLWIKEITDPDDGQIWQWRLER